MKHFYHILTAATFAFTGLLLLGSCHSDDKAIEDEWTATYVYLQRVDYHLKRFALITPVKGFQQALTCRLW